MNTILTLAAQAPPDGWIEGVAAIIISVLSWYLGRRERRKPRTLDERK